MLVVRQAHHERCDRMKEIFGPFTFETTTRELRRDGEIVKLQSQPAQVLAVLIEHAGEIVTRDAADVKRQSVGGDGQHKVGAQTPRALRRSSVVLIQVSARWA